MSGRRTNLALAGLLGAAFATGVLSFATGSGWAAWPVAAHGVAAFAMVVLVPWKSVVAGRSLGRKRPGRAASVMLAGLTSVAVVSGVLFSTGLVLRYGLLNAMQVHVGSALAAVPLAVVHLRRRPVRPQRTDLERRNLLRAGSVLAAGAVLYTAVEGTMRLVRLPGRNRRQTGSHERASFRPEAMPVTSWIDDAAPAAVAGEWRVAITAGDAQREWRTDELSGFGDEVTATLDCTSGWYSTQRWGGARLDRLLPAEEGRSFVVRSATGYRRRFPISDAGAMLLATTLGDAPLSPGHGAPVRIVAPGRRGFWWVKWVEEITVDDRPWWLQSPFPLT